MNETERTAAETVHTFMKHILYGQLEDAGNMITGDLESLGLPENGERATIVYSILGAEEETDRVIVPVDLEMGPPEDRSKQSFAFACVESEKGTKIDLDMTLERTLGVTPEILLDSMKEDIQHIAESAESALEEIPRDDPAPELYSPEYLSAEFVAGLNRIEELFDDEVEAITETLQNEDLEWNIAWGTMCDDEECSRRLLGSVLSPLRSALAMLVDHRSRDPEAERDASIRKIRSRIDTIRILNVNDHRLCGCTLEEGRLTLMPCLMTSMDSPTMPVQGFTSDEIEWAIRDALDLDVEPAIRRAEAIQDPLLSSLEDRSGSQALDDVEETCETPAKVDPPEIAIEEEKPEENGPVRSTEPVDARASDFRQMVDAMESDMMGPMRAQISQVFGKEFGLEVDWDSMDEDTDHFQLVVSGALGAVMGALMAMAYDASTKDFVTAKIGGLALHHDPAIRGVALSLDRDILNVACGGPASGFKQDPQAMGEMVLTLNE